MMVRRWKDKRKRREPSFQQSQQNNQEGRRFTSAGLGAAVWSAFAGGLGSAGVGWRFLIQY